MTATTGERSTSPTAFEPGQDRRSWSAGRIVAVVAGALVAVLGMGAVVTGAALMWFDATQRDEDGFVTTDSVRVETSTYALSSESFRLVGVADWAGVIGDVRATVATPGRDVFLGIGSSDDVAAYLAGVEHDVLTGIDTPLPGGAPEPGYRRQDGVAPHPPDQVSGVWVASATGTGVVDLDWPVESGSWTIVVMNADASREVVVDLAVGAGFPRAGDLGAWLSIGGAVLVTVGTIVVVTAARRS